MDTPNFRLQITDAEGGTTYTTLREFVADNEGVPGLCLRVAGLQPGQGLQDPFMGVIHRTEAKPPRYAHFRIPIKWDGSTEATVTVDRQRLNLIIRPKRRRQVVLVDLQALAERYLWQDAKIRAQERLKAKRAKRLARRQS